ncbi:MAG: hypothetical protein ACJ8BW_08795, partial [Ktedonobacteraceae bacterium]
MNTHIARGYRISIVYAFLKGDTALHRLSCQRSPPATRACQLRQALHQIARVHGARRRKLTGIGTPVE